MLSYSSKCFTLRMNFYSWRLGNQMIFRNGGNNGKQLRDTFPEFTSSIFSSLNYELLSILNNLKSLKKLANVNDVRIFNNYRYITQQNRQNVHAWLWKCFFSFFRRIHSKPQRNNFSCCLTRLIVWIFSLFH